MHRFVAGALCVAVTASYAVAAQTKTFITTEWRDFNASQTECLDRADRAIRDANFSVPGTTKDARHGTRGDYTIQVRCAAGKNIVIFITAGPNPDLTRKYTTSVIDQFE